MELFVGLRVSLSLRDSFSKQVLERGRFPNRTLSLAYGSGSQAFCLRHRHADQVLP